MESFYVRGSRGGNFPEMITLAQEAEVNRVLFKHGVPVPRIHGMIEDPPAIVDGTRLLLLALLPGRVNLAKAADDAEREAVLDAYVEAMRRMHAIDVREFGAIGLRLPADNRSAALNLYATGEANFRRAKSAPSPMIEFIWRWMQRNVPAGREQRALLQADSAQFLYENGTLSGLIDFEAAYIGDPVAEFAAMRSRDCEEPLGDIGRIARRYEAATGMRIEASAVEFHTAGWSLMTPFQWEHSVRHPAPGDSWLEYFTWLVGCGRWSARGDRAGGRHSAWRPSALAGRGPVLVLVLACVLQGTCYRCSTSGRVPETAQRTSAADRARAVTRFAEHVHAFGRELEAAEVREISEILGVRQPDVATAEAALEELVLTASPDRDAELVRYFHRWTQRQQFLIAGTGAHHERLIHISPQPLEGWS